MWDSQHWLSAGKQPLTPTDPDVLPGTADTAAPDGPDGEEGTGYLWDQAKRAGLSIRNYGFFVDLSRYNLSGPVAKYNIPEITDPYKPGRRLHFRPARHLHL